MITIRAELHEIILIKETENKRLRDALEVIRDSKYNGRHAVILATDALKGDE
tara:strand:- start:38855 stop:39010 length:156 start_codon:yes stop_codon:yes gene_type:complete